MNTTDNLFLQMRDDVFIHWDWLRRGKRAACQFLSQYVRSLYAELAISHLTPQTINASDDMPYDWKPCFSGQGCRAGVLDLQRGVPVSQSMYENSIGVALVLNVKSYLLHSNTRSFLSHIVKSPAYSHSRDLKPGDTCCVFPEQNTVDGFIPGNKAARVFVVLFQNEFPSNYQYSYPWVLGESQIDFTKLNHKSAPLLHVKA